MPVGRTRLRRYSLAVLCAAAAFLVSAFIYEPLVRVSPFLLFYAAVAFSSWYGGLRPGLLVTALGGLGVIYFQSRPGQLHLTSAELASRVAVFVIVGALIAWLNEQLQKEQLRCEREAARSARLASSNLVGVFFSDLTGQVRDGNEAFLQIIGFTREEMQRGAVNWRGLAAPEYKAADDRTFSELQQSRVCEPVEKEILRRDGTRVPVLWGCAMFDDSNEELINFVLDLTYRREIEGQVRTHERRLRAMASELMLAEERERRRIATVLHDAVGHTLALAKLKLGAFATTDDADALAVRVSEVQGLIEDAVEHTRTLTAELSSPVLYELGLSRALQWLGERLLPEHRIEFVFREDGAEKPVSQETRLVLFQAVRELFVNIVKHGNARTCTVTIARCDDSVELVVADDGTGFEPAQEPSPPAAKAGFGLFNIRERLAHLGGEMEIASSPGQGTRVTLRAPLERKSPEGAADEREDPVSGRSPDDARGPAEDAR